MDEYIIIILLFHLLFNNNNNNINKSNCYWLMLSETILSVNLNAFCDLQVEKLQIKKKKNKSVYMKCSIRCYSVYDDYLIVCYYQFDFYFMNTKINQFLKVKFKFAQ